MSDFFDYISGKKRGRLAAVEARAEYSEGILGAVLEENEKLRAEIKEAWKQRNELAVLVGIRPPEAND